MRRPLVTPSLVISLLALFFALGIRLRVAGGAPKRPATCPVGSARAIAYVTGDVNRGIANLPDTWSSAAGLFG